MLLPVFGTSIHFLKEEIMLTLQAISYIHPNKHLLFENLSATISPHNKVGLIGNNGTGKSTLLKVIAGELMPSSGSEGR